jgi:hypothetical protein
MRGSEREQKKGIRMMEETEKEKMPFYKNPLSGTV